VQLALDDLAGSVREGLLALSVGVGLKESMLSICRERARNVKRWRGGETSPSRRRRRPEGGGRLPDCCLISQRRAATKIHRERDILHLRAGGHAAGPCRVG
jgi:hypothetical protein